MLFRKLYPKCQRVEIPRYKPEVLEAMEEAKLISRDPNTKRYSSFAEALGDSGFI